MFKTFAAVAALMTTLSGAAMAQTVTAGQYIGQTQYTGLVDPSGICATLGLAVGQKSTSVSTVTGLGNTFAQVIANVGAGTTNSAYGVTPIACSFGALPAAGAFTANADGSYTATPSTPSITTCASSKGTFTLTSQNGTVSGLTATYAVTVLNSGAGSLNSSFATNTTNTALASGGTTLCYLSTSAQYSLSN